MDPKRQASTPPVKVGWRAQGINGGMPAGITGMRAAWRLQVVGFHVEGASPSPRPTTLSDTASRDVSSSPSPVIIPPLFQVRAHTGFWAASALQHVAWGSAVHLHCRSLCRDTPVTVPVPEQHHLGTVVPSRRLSPTQHCEGPAPGLPPPAYASSPAPLMLC